MRATRSRCVTGVLAFASLSALQLHAQSPRSPVSVDVIGGFAKGWGGGDRVDRSLPSADLIVVVRAKPGSVGTTIVGLSAARRWQTNGDLLCVPTAEGGCVPQFPGLAMLGFVIGKEWTTSDAALRVMGGAGYYAAYYDHNAVTTSTGGLSARADAAFPSNTPIALTVAVREDWVPRLRQAAYGSAMLGVGLRVSFGP